MIKEINKIELMEVMKLVEDELKFLEEANQKSVFESEDHRRVALAAERIGVATAFSLKRLNRIEKFLNIPKQFIECGVD